MFQPNLQLDYWLFPQGNATFCYNDFYWCWVYDPSTLVKLTIFKRSLCFFLTSFTKLSIDSSSLRMPTIVPIGDSEFFPFMKWFNILEWTMEFLPTTNCPISPFLPTSTLIVSKGKVHLLGIWILEKMSCFVAHSLFNCSKVTSSSFTKTSR